MSPPVTITWWGAACIELVAGTRRLVVDPVEAVPAAEIACVCLTRPDHDHLRPAVVAQLASAPALEQLVIAPACSALDRLSAPVASGADDPALVAAARVLQPHEQTEAAGFRIQALPSSLHEPPTTIDSWQHLRTADEPVWPSPSGPLVAKGDLAPVGFLITDADSGLALYHPGDLQEVLDTHRELRGKVDCLLLPLSATQGIELSLVDAIRPVRVIPIHHHPGEPTYRSSSVDVETGFPLAGAQADEYRREIQRLVAAGWFATPTDPETWIADVRAKLCALEVELIDAQLGRPIKMRRALSRGRHAS